MSEKVKKMLVLNPENENDREIIKYLEKKKFSGYIRQLIGEDMKKNNNEEIRDLMIEIRKLREDMQATHELVNRRTGASNDGTSNVSELDVVNESEKTEEKIKEAEIEEENKEDDNEKAAEVRNMFENFI